ncbi:alpha/beta hydrolase [Tsuneonella sp. YG55]|uniref:Alpha/beta hydrolase n=1 Tax=Tsuneonella litorea TaxID=2976475 RepID=A0A9X3ALR5_9SPHN|nr:alpha/beta hydrolase [Tsuneonella litorea]MCT2560224.1 alpha/beta hydrolase [Tsuneonella litorea]
MVSRALAGEPQRDYFIYVPQSRPASRISVLVHGISENACEQTLRFVAESEKHGTILIAPLFRRSVFGQYQQLIDGQSGIRADRALFDIIGAIRAELGLSEQRFDLFGFSGGGQFVHRFAFVHPRSVRSCVLVAPGWYTFPDNARAYPQGLRGLPLDEPSFDEDAVGAIPFHVVVGDQDVVRDGTLRSSPGMDRRQGRTRLERAVRWHRAMRKWGAHQNSSLTILGGLGHCFAEAVSDHDLPRLTFELWDNS